MKQLCALLSVPTAEGHQVVAISPTDDVWFITPDACPPEFKEWLEQTMKGAEQDLLGFIFLGDTWIRQ